MRMFEPMVPQISMRSSPLSSLSTVNCRVHHFLTSDPEEASSFTGFILHTMDFTLVRPEGQHKDTTFSVIILPVVNIPLPEYFKFNHSQYTCTELHLFSISALKEHSRRFDLIIRNKYFLAHFPVFRVLQKPVYSKITY